MSKIEPVRIQCDELSITVGTQTYYPHKGEYIDVRPLLTIGEKKKLVKAQAAFSVLQTSEKDERVVDELYGMMAALVQVFVVSWNWTDWEGDPLPQLTDSPDVIDSLVEEEIAWIFSQCTDLIQGDGGEEKKEVSSVSMNSSRAKTA